MRDQTQETKSRKSSLAAKPFVSLCTSTQATLVTQTQTKGQKSFWRKSMT